MQTLNAEGLHFKELNKSIKNLIKSKETEIYLKNVQGQRYIGNALQGDHKITIEGTPGNDMAVYMDGPEIIVKGNVQDATANTMNRGRIIVYGNAGDATGYAMRGGEIFIKGDVGYRVGIHMKEFSDKKPVMVIGGKAGDFLGEYMAGGMVIVLGLNLSDDQEIVGNFCGTGMHGGVMYLRGSVKTWKLGKEVKLTEPDDEDLSIIKNYVKRFSKYFGINYNSIIKEEFTKLIAFNKRPYGNLYAY
ncbi:hypothetical protein RBH29_07075 [Herbivorax sp. ANBcel31]|uniref:GltB/FmdC/FwdC-like GXGXG domain-containing protein n=1 Tax=Herbivorax sp. ANBcel31 TaxID=3069754 RepID=UPI0027B23764|nr:hypothetical protein [Herbivorax sp. ANBcel31]MDQ2086190.1 hypothetical protein [Herbivorax sp. ANBcel31]